MIVVQDTYNCVYLGFSWIVEIVKTVCPPRLPRCLCSSNVRVEGVFLRAAVECPDDQSIVHPIGHGWGIVNREVAYQHAISPSSLTVYALFRSLWLTFQEPY